MTQDKVAFIKEFQALCEKHEMIILFSDGQFQIENLAGYSDSYYDNESVFEKVEKYIHKIIETSRYND